MSISRASTDSTQRPPESARPVQDIPLPPTPALDIPHPPTSALDISRPPLTPAADSKYGSLRSILRDSNTPAKGQSVRFFSRDAYKMISPDVSAASASEQEDFCFISRLQRSIPTRPAVQDPAAIQHTPSKCLRTARPQSFFQFRPDRLPVPYSQLLRVLSRLAVGVRIEDEGSALRGISTTRRRSWFTPRREREKDPFGAHAATYYTPLVPPTPPTAPPGTHVRTASREEDLILSLRTQLALQAELCAQYEVDLGARDELVQMLQGRLDDAEREGERRKGVLKGWRKRVNELERCVRGLQDEVERSREESAERSVMDEASGEALKMLHRRIEDLEREKGESDRREQRMKAALEERSAELARVREELRRRDESEKELKEGIRAAREEMEQMGEQSHETDTTLRHEQASLHDQLIVAREEFMQKEKEIGVLKAELDAQWRNTEQAGERIRALKEERNELRADADSLNAKISSMEMEWNQSENRKTELELENHEAWAAKDDLERERNELEDQIHSLQDQLSAEQELAEQLTQALQEREDRVTTVEREHKFTLDNVARLEARLHQRDDEMGELTKSITSRETDTESALEEMSKMKREHARIVNEQSRTLQDVVAREVEARANMEAMVRDKAETDVVMGTLKERVSELKEEVERLRRHVHELQQESADKEVKLAHFVKQRAQDKDDLQGLNIALDSKQQELELLKRRIGVRGTAGSTPQTTQLSKVHRRESSIFGTPSVAGSRPSSVLSDASSVTKDRRMTDTSSTVKKPALGKSVRPNATGNAAIPSKRSLEGSMGPPPALTRASSASATSATPTRIPSISGMHTAVATTPSTIGKSTAGQRRMSSSMFEPSRLRTAVGPRATLSPVSGSSELDEKENSAPPTRTTKRLSVLVPA
ncbi:hypothetical protein A0H81_02742 [Grifola frondosa]|uniref:Uncharacterized protein n=1 Tax=Grifola frondosa TaxID=5627 RepID=A0A1C7MKI5_GRIFR|nr:hypothetical protein A0H81_02742 [Grifola frondosa]